MTGPTVGQEAAPQSTVFRETVCQQAVPPLGIQKSVKLPADPGYTRRDRADNGQEF